MKFNINRHMFTQVNQDSAALNLMSSAVHQFSKPGDYSGIVSSGQTVTGRFSLTVAPSQSARSPDANPASRQSEGHAGEQLQSQGHVRIDLKNPAPGRYSMRAGGYCTFYVSSGPGTYSVEVSRMEAEGSANEFDSTQLKSGDYFSAMMIRPGTYTVLNTVDNSRSELVVNYPEAGKAQKGARAANIECTPNHMSPARITLDPPQGLVFVCKTACRIKIELSRPEDRTARLRARTAAATKAHAQTSQRSTTEKKPIRRYRLMPRAGGGSPKA